MDRQIGRSNQVPRGQAEIKKPAEAGFFDALEGVGLPLEVDDNSAVLVGIIVRKWTL